MSKPLLGLLLGAVLGAIDGVSALFYEGTGPVIVTIICGSTAKGLVAGLIAGLVARKTRSQAVPLIVGFAASALFSYLATIGNVINGKPIFWEIMLPGMALGLICGFATARYGRVPSSTPGASASTG